jgi:hypothetical protein
MIFPRRRAAVQVLLLRALVLLFMSATGLALLLWSFSAGAPMGAAAWAWATAGVAHAALVLFVDGRLARHGWRVAEQPEELAPGERRMLVGSSAVPGGLVVLDRAGEFFPPGASPDAREIIKFVRAPAHPGLYVWTGQMIDVVTGDRETRQVYAGTWRRATPAEVLRYAAGEPVWGSR